MKQTQIPPRASRTQDYVQPDIETEDGETPDEYYPQRLPTSTRCYYTSNGN